MGDLLLVLLPAIALVALIWGIATALRPRDAGTSEADKYQRELAERSARHYAAQVQAATAARARLAAATHPSQNAQQHNQQQEHIRAGGQQSNGTWQRPGSTKNGS
ncbi:hypothetical protein [Pseudarthrobacter sp. LT1]|jgi:hypothetical protein|uniref:hypothetical protein n=1 Tax=Pseudarthrobacter sp. LT1 TaxID=3111450 RepID=UPI002D79D968|nr:hypothetical protein [Pseudarthrobacter sp. LT1]WRT13861.1 hypothetical protein VIK36_21430 [Pseudarthrobacter sp. LT1]